jgi:hypothetical protein
MRDTTIKHLASDRIALSLDEDVHGTSGDLDDKQIESRLIENIHIETNYQYVADGFPARVVAKLIRQVWEHKDRECAKSLEEVSRAAAQFYRDHGCI